jgi:hypothetical protein
VRHKCQNLSACLEGFPVIDEFEFFIHANVRIAISARAASLDQPSAMLNATNLTLVLSSS